YIREVWDEWLDDPTGPLLVGELDGQPVTLMKLSDLGSGECWLHGLRVAEEVRRRGFARAMITHALSLVQAAGDGVARFMTSEDNHPIHHIAEELGCRPVAAGVWFAGRGTPSERRLVPLDELHLDWLLEQIRSSDLLERNHGLYAFHWRFQPLGRDALRDHLSAGQVLHLPDSDAWAIVDYEDTWLGFGHGAPEPLATLLRGLLAHPALSTGQELFALTPPECELARQMVAAGFRQDAHGERCYEWRPSGR
ncbi:MAG TPA: GNAT family N-acetyltransferase, partial [Anaerolineaceae bacterium]|nr:GNAT family N-acetyltransferase [Anaerolineaceae bacterium]